MICLRKIESVWIIAAGIAGYFILLLITRFAFHRIVTAELILIVGWVMMETAVICDLNAAAVSMGMLTAVHIFTG